MRHAHQITRSAVGSVITAAVAAGVFAISTIGCTSSGLHVEEWEQVNRGVAVIHPTANSDVSGTVTFTEVEGGVRVLADIEGLEPNQAHGFHIHQYGDCSSLDGASAGSHYDPEGTEHHAEPNATEPHHAGDLGNLEADSSGAAHYDKVIQGITIAGRKCPIVGRAIIIHSDRDQFTQPTGDAGGRIACGVIGIAKPSGG